MAKSFPDSVYNVERSLKTTKEGCNSYWNYSCKICSVDEYVENKLCSGVFESFSGNLQQGQKSCRCSTGYRWTDSQRKFQIEKQLIGTLWSFVGWSSQDRKAKSKIRLKCKEHDVWETSLDNFFSKNSRCPSCANSGFDPSKASFLYVLKVEGKNNFTGFGISNQWKKRIVTHKRNIGLSDSSITDKEILEVPGEKARFLENEIMKRFKVCSQDIIGFKKEATFLENYQEVINFIKSLFPDLSVNEIAYKE